VDRPGDVDKTIELLSPLDYPGDLGTAMMKQMTPFLILILLAASAAAAPPVRGIAGKKAPSWKVDQWINLEEGLPGVDVDSYSGKVLYLYCFQSWCPGCHSSGFPTLQSVSQTFTGDEDVAFVAIQTVFEGFRQNTAEKTREVAEKYSLNMPIGHSGSPKERSHVMAAYRTGGTPWTIIIDPQGIVRFNDFHIKPLDAVHLIRKLKPSPASTKPSDG